MRVIFNALPSLLYLIKILYAFRIIFKIIFGNKINFISSILKMTIISITFVLILIVLCVININANLSYDITPYITNCIIISLEMFIYVIYLAIYLFKNKIAK